ncbi:MAG: hemopexin repeat-containing protein [Acidobacteriota bacterium]|nr:hemopexin repeat-containing protein [Acidobacteriota bacterium]
MSLTLVFGAVLALQPNRFDAMLTWKNNKMYAFSGTYYYRYDLAANRMDPGYPRPIQGNWPGLGFNTVDAAVNWQNGKAYFFSGGWYTRYDIATDRADPGYPKPIQAAWNVNWTKVDAALARGNGKFYLFNNATQTYMRYSAGGQWDPGYPQYTSRWTGWPFPMVDAASGYSGRIYFTQGGNFMRQVYNTGVGEPGYPKPLSWMPDVGRGSTPPPTTRPPAPTPPPTYAPPTNQAGTCTVNGTLTYLQYGAYKQWNNVTVELYQANGYLPGRRQQLMNAGYTFENAMKQCTAEPNLWTRATTAVTKPTQYVSNKYGWNYSWFGFVRLKPNAYMVKVPGYPNLTRWLNFTGPNQKLDVALEHQ